MTDFDDIPEVLTPLNVSVDEIEKTLNYLDGIGFINLAKLKNHIHFIKIVKALHESNQNCEYQTFDDMFDCEFINMLLDSKYSTKWIEAKK